MNADHHGRLRRRLLETGIRAVTRLEIPSDDPWRVRELPILSRAREQLTLELERVGGFSDVDDVDVGPGTDIQAKAEEPAAGQPERDPRRLTRRELADRGGALHDES